MEKKNSRNIIILLGAVILVLIVIVLALILNKNKPTEENNEVNNVAEINNLEEYVDESYGISFKYSKELKNQIGGSSEVNLEHPKIAGSKFFYNSPDIPNVSYNKEDEIKRYIQTRASFGNDELIKQEETTISKNNPIQCTFLEYVVGQYTEYIYIIPHRAGVIYIGIRFPTEEPIKEFNDIIDSITMN